MTKIYDEISELMVQMTSRNIATYKHLIQGLADALEERFFWACSESQLDECLQCMKLTIFINERIKNG